MSLTGKCLCGAISYSIDNQPAVTGVCHCKNCQRQAGSAFLPSLVYQSVNYTLQARLSSTRFQIPIAATRLSAFFAVTADHPFTRRYKALPTSST